MNNEEIAFLILNLLHSSKDYYIAQSLKTTTPKLENVEEESILKQFSDVQLLGMYYTIKISQEVEEDFLLFATPLEHLLSTNIILEKNSSLYRIEYEYKVCLILPQHIDYLQKPYTFLEEIESHYFENYSYSPSFKQEIIAMLPQSNYFLKKIIINSEENENSSLLFTHYKPLLTPHINSYHANFCIENEIFIFDITHSKEFLKYVYKYSYFTSRSTTKHFFGGEIISYLSTRYSIEILPSYSNIALNCFPTTFCFKASPNTYLPLITTHKSNYPLPIFISQENNFLEFTNLESFKERTGVHFKFDYDLLQKLIIKENHLHNSQLCHFFIPKNTAYLLFEKSPANIYTSPTQYHLKSLLFNSKKECLEKLKFGETKVFKYNYSKEINRLIELTKYGIIANTHYPDSSKQSIISHYCMYIFKQLEYSKEELSLLIKKTNKNSEKRQNELNNSFNLSYCSIHERIYEHIQHLLHTLNYIKITENEIYEINLILQTLYQIIQIESKSSSNIKNKTFDFSKVDFSFFIELNLFNANTDEECFESSKEILKNYNGAKIELHYKTIYSISLLFNFLSRNSFNFTTTNSSLEKVLSTINIKSKENENSSKKNQVRLFSNSIIDLYLN